MSVLKSAFYKIYDEDGVYVTSWNKDVVSVPQFTWSINGTIGEQVITLAREAPDFGETDDVAMFNEVQTWVQDGDSPNGIRIHHGFISSYDIEISADGKQNIKVHVVPYTVEAEKIVAKDSGANTTLTYSSYEPAQILRDLISKMNMTLTYNSTSIEDTSTTVSYVYKYVSFYEAMRKVVELCPAYWYWYLDANDLVHLHDTDFDTINHTLFVGQQIQSIVYSKTIENMYNIVYFLGGGDPALYKKYENTGSSSEYGDLEYRMQDTRVTTAATAQTMAEKFLNERDHFEQEVKVVVLDNNASDASIFGTKGYDLESLKPGDVVNVRHAQVETNETLWYNDTGLLGNMVWDVSFWDFDIRFSLGVPMQIQAINYQFDKAEVTLSTRLPDVPKRIEDIERNLVILESDAVPAVPS